MLLLYYDLLVFQLLFIIITSQRRTTCENNIQNGSFEENRGCPSTANACFLAASNSTNSLLPSWYSTGPDSPYLEIQRNRSSRGEGGSFDGEYAIDLNANQRTFLNQDFTLESNQTYFFVFHIKSSNRDCRPNDDIDTNRNITADTTEEQPKTGFAAVLELDSASWIAARLWTYRQRFQRADQWRKIQFEFDTRNNNVTDFTLIIGSATFNSTCGALIDSVGIYRKGGCSLP